MEQTRSETDILILEKITPRFAYISDGNRLIKVLLDEVTGCSTGDVLIKTDNGYITDTEQTRIRRSKLSALKGSLME